MVRSDSDASKASARARSLVRLEGLTKTYQEGDRLRQVLDGLDARFDAGDLIVLLGRSGSGKSTLLNLVSGIDLPTSGSVTIAGTDLTALSERERTLFRRHHIGFVFQAFNLIPTLSVLENLLFPMELIGERGRVDRARALLEKVGLGDRADTFPDRLSGGERQRVAIGRALAHEPRLILADEPTGNLDYETGRHVMDLLETLVRDHGTTMIVATHDRDIVPRANRVVQLRDGRLEEMAPSSAPGAPA